VATAEREDEALARAQAIRAALIEACVPQHPDKIETRGEASEETSGLGSRVKLEVLGGQLDTRYAARMEEAWREQKEVARRALADAQARRLHLAVERQAKTGDPELVRLLALEAARLDRSADTDRALRGVLDRRGTLLHHFEARAPANCLAWSPDGQRLAVGYHNGKLRLWDVERGQPLGEVDAHPGGTDVSTNRVAWSPRGYALASTGSDSMLALWRPTPEGLEPMGSLGVNTWNHCGLEFSTSGAHLLSPWSSEGADQKGAAVFRMNREGHLVEPSEQDLLPGAFDAVAWMPSSQPPRFATVGGGQVALWCVTKEGPKPFQEFPFEGASSLAWTRKGDALAVGGARGACILRPGEGAKPLPLDTQGQPVQQVAWSTDGKHVLATMTRGSALHVWEASGQLRTVIRVDGEGLLQSVLGHPERPEVALTWGGEAACVWDLSTGRQLAWLGGHTGLIHEAAWSADGKRVATASADGSVRVWEPLGGGPKRYTWSEFEAQHTRGKTGKRFRWPSDGVRFSLEAEAGKQVWVASRGEGQELLVQVRASKNGRPALKPWKPGKPLPAGVMLEEHGPEPLHWSPDGSMAVLREPERVSVWDAKTWKLRAEHAPGQFGATHAVWHPSGKLLAISRFSGWGAVMLWDLERSPEPVSLEGAEEPDGVWDIAWSPDGEKLITACNDSHVRVYSVSHADASATLVMRLRPSSVPRRVAWSPQGDLIACGDGSGAVEIWNTEEKDLVSSPQLRLQRIEHLVWSPDGSHLFSADRSGRALLWRRQGGSWVTAAVLDAEPVRLRWAVFSDDGTWVATMDQDGKVRLHPVEFGSLVATVKALPGRKEFTSRERAQYLDAGSHPPQGPRPA
jgi:WD40 repeat protein